MGRGQDPDHFVMRDEEISPEAEAQLDILLAELEEHQAGDRKEQREQEESIDKYLFSFSAEDESRIIVVSESAAKQGVGDSEEIDVQEISEYFQMKGIEIQAEEGNVFLLLSDPDQLRQLDDERFLYSADLDDLLD